jgi:UDP:flavonoid glycosyltransferase YjiC (YdhE family)
VSRALLVCHDAGGTVPPIIALAEALVGRGHEVVVLSQPSVRGRAEGAGCTFLEFSGLPDYATNLAIEDQIDVALPAVAGRAVGDDLVAVAADRDVDLVVVDANLSGALAAAETLATPSVVLLHSMYRTFVDTWFADLWPFIEQAVNDTRAAFDLAPASGWPAVFAGHDRLLSVVPKDFDAPTADVPATMRHFGFLAPRVATPDPAPDFGPGDGGRVLVGLSTTYQHQEALIQTILDALGSLPVRGLVTTAGGADRDELRVPTNVVVVDHAPHGVVLRDTDVMVTHAGLGSVAAALTAGVPLVCTPISRDQPLNAERVASLGAGLVVDGTATSDGVAEAIQTVLSTPTYRQRAQAVGRSSTAAGGAAAAAADLESLAPSAG